MCSPNSGWLCRKSVLLSVVVWNVVARPSDYASLPSSLDAHEELIGIVLTIMPCIGYNGCIRLDLENALIVIQNLVRGPCDCRSRVRTELWLLVALHVHGSSLVDQNSVIPRVHISRVPRNMCSLNREPASSQDKVTVIFQDEVAFQSISRAFLAVRCLKTSNVTRWRCQSWYSLRSLTDVSSRSVISITCEPRRLHLLRTPRLSSHLQTSGNPPLQNHLDPYPPLPGLFE